MYFHRLVLATVKQSSRVVLKRWRKPPEKPELEKYLEKFYLSDRQKDRGSTKQLLSEALELVKEHRLVSKQMQISFKQQGAGCVCQNTEERW